MLKTSSHIAVAGAGLLGRLSAWQLLKRGHKVTLFDAAGLDGAASSAHTAAGMLSPMSEAVVSERCVYDMGLYALERWPQWTAELPSPAPRPLFHHRGSLLVAHPQDHSELVQFERELGFVLNQSQNPDDCQWLNAQAIQSLEPDISGQFQQALMLRNEGHLDNRPLLEVLLTQLETLGADLRPNTPVDVAPGRICTAGGDTERYDWVIDTRGLGARPHQSQLRGVRGETLHIQTPEVQLQRPVRLMHPRYQLYIVPKPDNCFVIGATQIESEDDSPMSLQSSLELSSALYTLAPAFAEGRILEMDVGLRPAFMDNLPRLETTDGLTRANGLFRHGYLLAPAVVDSLLSDIAGEPECFNQQLRWPDHRASA